MVIVVCSLVLARVPSVHDFNSITSLFSDHTPDINVMENIACVQAPGSTRSHQRLFPFSPGFRAMCVQRLGLVQVFGFSLCIACE
jgi:hypothetical protein